MEDDAAQSRLVRFGIFEADLGSGELRRNGVKIKLQRQPFEVLAMLLGRSGGVVTREELRERLWPGRTFVDFDVGVNKAVRKVREALGDSAQTPHYIETLPQHGYRFITPVTEASPAIRSLAVLPLQNLSGDVEQEYFSDGVTDALITELSKVGALRVISRQSVIHYKGGKKPLDEISRELQVDAVLEGAVQRAGDRVLITVQLVQARPEKLLWAENYERRYSDILTLQGEIARDTARQVRATLTPDQVNRLGSARPVDPEAYEAYLRGRYFFYSYTPERLQKASESFETAVGKDPDFALAWAALSYAYGALGYWGYVQPSEVIPKAKAAALRAVELDDTLADAHGVLGGYAVFAEWNWGTAEQEIKRAIELNPSHPDAHAYYGMMLGSLRRPREAMEKFQIARELDPLQPRASSVVAWCSYISGRYKQAIEELRHAVELAPDFFITRWYLWRALHRTGEDAGALKECKRMYELLKDAEVVQALEQGERRSGYPGAMSEAAETLARRSKTAYVSGVQVALLFAHAGENDAALEQLEKAYEESDPRLHTVWADPDWEALYSKPRFQQLLRNMGFPSVEKAAAWSR